VRMAMAWAIARAEMRSTRRLTRYWVFSIIAVVMSFMTYMFYSVIHGMFSHMTASIGPVGPRFLVAAMGMQVLMVFLLGLVFLAFDVRARDVRERMYEVLDSRPISNLEFVVGRGMGLALMAFIPLVVLSVILQSFGSLALLLEWPIGEPVEPMSVIGLLISAFATFVMWSALIVFFAVTVGNRLVVAVLGLAILGLQFWGMLQLPVYMQSVLGFAAAFVPASDLLSSVGADDSLFQRFALLVLGVGLFLVAAGVHPRLDDARRQSLSAGAGLCVVAALMLGGLFMYQQAGMELGQRWLHAHEAKSSDPYVDILHKSGSIVIDPGDELAMDIAMRVRAPDEQSLDALLFTLNPGLEVDEVRVDGDAVTWTHENGLLEIAHALGRGQESTVELVSGGVPNTSFGYLDSVINFLADSTMKGQTIALLGVQASVFDSRYVALTPGTHWLPKAGTDVPSGDSRTHSEDYFTVDLEVTIPKDWKLAGPGAKEVVGEGTYRFNQTAPLSMVGLFAADFVSRQMRVGGVDFEMLLDPSHDRNLKFFADATEELAVALDERLADAERLGFSYPYGTLTVVEVPGDLRGYSGGWRMDSTQSLPGILQIKETGFPTSRFENEFDDPERFASEEGGAPRAKIRFAKEFFRNDISGGNILAGSARNLFLFQTSAKGEGALALNFVIGELVQRLVGGSDEISYFTPFIHGQQSGFIIGETVTNMVSGRADSVAQSIMDSATNRPSVWDMALGTPLADLDTTGAPQDVINVLALKSQAIALSILESVGEKKTAELLVSLRDTHLGDNFTADDFALAAADVGVDLESIIGDWLHDTALPGFVTSSISQERLEDDERGNPQYQTKFHVRNDETTPGLVRFTLVAWSPTDKKAGQAPREDKTPTYRMAGKESLEIGIITDQPVMSLSMHPFLSLNRSTVNLNVPKVDFKQRLDAEPFLGVRPSNWSPDQYDDIVVDDLDTGFSVTGTPPVVGGGRGVVTPPVDLDQGLPQFNLIFGVPAIWSRQENDTGWGKYRHTAAVVRAGDGNEVAHFKTRVPEAGRWRLGFHVPNMSGRDFNKTMGQLAGVQMQFAPKLGTYEIALIVDGEQELLEFDGGAAEAGWNTLGDFELGTSEVEVRVTNVTSGGAVVADAIRWTPVGS
jgi:ABC-type transport system involved in multi-copper enzyme maturation permease subunit